MLLVCPECLSKCAQQQAFGRDLQRTHLHCWVDDGLRWWTSDHGARRRAPSERHPHVSWPVGLDECERFLVCSMGPSVEPKCAALRLTDDHITVWVLQETASHLLVWSLFCRASFKNLLPNFPSVDPSAAVQRTVSVTNLFLTACAPSKKERGQTSPERKRSTTGENTTSLCGDRRAQHSERALKSAHRHSLQRPENHGQLQRAHRVRTKFASLSVFDHVLTTTFFPANVIVAPLLVLCATTARVGFTGWRSTNRVS